MKTANNTAAQAIIFDLSAFADDGARSVRGQARPAPQAGELLDAAIEQGRHCALVTDLPQPEAGQQLRAHFGDTAHHIFSVVLTGADYKARGHKAPYSIVLRALDLPPEEALVVAASQPALRAARQSCIATQT